MWLSHYVCIYIHIILDFFYAVCTVGKTKKNQNKNEAKKSINDAENPHPEGLRNLTSNLKL